eukprot:4811279-Amphidinium_carterae.1
MEAAWTTYATHLCVLCHCTLTLGLIHSGAAQHGEHILPSNAITLAPARYRVSTASHNDQKFEDMYTLVAPVPCGSSTPLPPYSGPPVWHH